MESSQRLQVEIKRKIKKFLYLGSIVFYLIAGINHLVNPVWYYPLIPSYLPYPEIINVVAGMVEILGGLGLVFASTKKIASNILVLMLIAFIPSHWHFIQQGSCIDTVLCVSPWIAWIRLVVIHPLLIWVLLWIKKTSYGFSNS